MKINFDSGDELPLNKTIEISMIILVTAILFFFLNVINIIHKFS